MCKGLDDSSVELQINQVNFYKENIDCLQIDQFRRTSIINFPKIEFKKVTEINKKSLLESNIYNLKNYSRKTELNKNFDFLNWHIKNFRDFYNLIEDLKNISINSRFRTIDELFKLIEIIQSEKIDLFIIKGHPKQNNESLEIGCFVSELNCIYINSDYFFDIDRICNVLTHELIHYFQKDIPFNIEIEDSIIEMVLVSEKYKDLKGDLLQCELEAFTYENYPYFIEKCFRSRDTLKEDFFVPRIRLSTIKWICEHRVQPLDSLSSKSVYKLDFSL